MVDKIIIKKTTHSWTRYGGSNNDYIERTKEWACQACGDSQPESIDAYLFPIGISEFIRICPLCQNIVIKNKIEYFSDLKNLVRRPDEEWDTIVIIANLKKVG